MSNYTNFINFMYGNPLDSFNERQDLMSRFAGILFHPGLHFVKYHIRCQFSSPNKTLKWQQLEFLEFSDYVGMVI